MFVTLVPSYFVLCYNYLALGFAINIQVYYAFLRAFFTRYLLFTVLKLLEQSSGPSKVFFQCPRIISKAVDSKLNYMQVNFYIQATGLLSQLILHINFVKIFWILLGTVKYCMVCAIINKSIDDLESIT